MRARLARDDGDAMRRDARVAEGARAPRDLLHAARGIGRGDAVFLPAFTYTATAEVPLVLGATPVFVDVDPRTFQIAPAHLRARIADVRAAGRLRPSLATPERRSKRR